MASAFPFWMKQRQIKPEQLNEDTLQLKAPNLPTFELVLRPAEGGRWLAVLSRPGGEGQKEQLGETPAAYANRQTAWEAGFELFRQTVIV